MRQRLLCGAVAALGVACAVAAAAAPAQERYWSCRGLIYRDAARAVAVAQAWASETGDPRANACGAEALVELGRYREAAGLYREIGIATAAYSPMDAARALRWAARAMLLAGDGRAALRDLREAARLVTGAELAEVRLDEAVVQRVLGNPLLALDAVKAARAQGASRRDVWLVRGAVYRALGLLDQAQADVDRLLALDSLDPMALVLRARLQLDRGDRAAARRDLRWVLDLAPVSPAGREARRLLEALRDGDHEDDWRG